MEAIWTGVKAADDSACPAAEESEMDRLFKHIFSQQSLFTTVTYTPWSPPTDVYETTGKYVIRIEIPGIAESETKIEMNANVLHVRGQRPDVSTDTKLSFQQMEIHYGYFEKVVTLPHGLGPEEPVATYSGGFLCISIAKSGSRRGQALHINIEPRENSGDV